MIDPAVARAVAIAERVARACMPDLAGVPLYILQPRAGSMLTREMTCQRGGLYFPNLDVAFRNQLEADGKWRGRGVGIVVDATLLFACEPDDDDAQRAVIGSALHELAHWVDRLTPTSEPPVDVYAAFRNARRPDAPRPGNDPPRQFSDSFLAHAENFIRLCSHLWHRARHGGGYSLRPERLHFGNAYPGLEYLPSPPEFIDALWPELTALQDLPLRSLADIPAPKPFTDLWDSVLETYCVNNSAA